MHELFASLPQRLAGTLAGDWAAGAVVSRPVDLGAWEELFLQVGVPLSDELRGVLTRAGAFELLSFGEADHEEDGGRLRPTEFLRELHGPGWAGRQAVLEGLHLLSPEELFETYTSQRAAASALAALGGFWVFAAPRHSLWTSAFAFDARSARLSIVPFHEDDIHEQLDLERPDGTLPHAQPSLAQWAGWLLDEICLAVRQAEDAGCAPALTRRASPTREVELAPFLAEVASGKRWSAWVDGVWRQALRRGSVETARQVLSHVGTLVTRPDLAPWKLPGALDLLYRLPAAGPGSRRVAVLQLWNGKRPASPLNQVAYDTLLGLLESEAPAPLDTLRSLQAVAWSYRGPPADDEVRWARALLWALGRPRPEHVLEAATLVLGERSRDAAMTCWLRLEPLVCDAGAL
ncbi:MAG: hypothetical protein JNJ54_19085 [Myxococcaceae bacterium]|nr:hypothetical protein [Myxococcaceae bacterium]